MPKTMLPNAYAGQHCSIASTLEIVGERWTMLILRDAFLGVRRFEHFQKRNGIARNVLSARLERLVEAGILRRRRYSERPPRDEYLLTEKGLDLWPTLVAMLKWGDKHVYAGARPKLLFHRDCGGEVSERRTCERCGAELGPRDVRAEPGLESVPA
jgi:DNA-binding HxlR family transcriptional regulator